MEKPFLFSETEVGETRNFEDVSPILKKNLERNISGATDNSSISDLGSPPKVKRPFQKSFTIEIKAHNNYKSVMQKKVNWAFLLFFTVIIERIFVSRFQAEENGVIVALQRHLGITYGSQNWYIEFFLYMEKGTYFYLLLTHFFLILYYYVNPVTCLKVMQVTLNALVSITLLEILFGEGRPFWEDSNIVGVQCTNSYSFPSYSLFGVMFMFMYTRHCLKSNDAHLDDHSNSTLRRTVVAILFGIFVLLLSFFQVLGGITYITQVIVNMIYAIFAYSLAMMFDKGITKLVEKSCIDIQGAKRYSIFWLIYLSIVGGTSAILYNSANPYVDMTWLQNYMNCIINQNETASVASASAYHLIGPWGSFTKTGVVLMLLGAIFGTAKTFRDFKGIIWYAVDGKKKLKMAIFANLCLIPSWMVLIASYTDFSGLSDINIFLINAVHLFALYFILFGLLPKYVFAKWNLVKTESDYHYVPDYLNSEQEMAL